MVGLVLRLRGDVARLVLGHALCELATRHGGAVAEDQDVLVVELVVVVDVDDGHVGLGIAVKVEDDGLVALELGLADDVYVFRLLDEGLLMARGGGGGGGAHVAAILGGTARMAMLGLLDGLALIDHLAVDLHVGLMDGRVGGGLIAVGMDVGHGGLGEGGLVLGRHGVPLVGGIGAIDATVPLKDATGAHLGAGRLEGLGKGHVVLHCRHGAASSLRGSRSGIGGVGLGLASHRVDGIERTGTEQNAGGATDGHLLPCGALLLRGLFCHRSSLLVLRILYLGVLTQQLGVVACHHNRMN